MQVNEENIVNILSLSNLEQILESSNPSNENGDTLFGYKRFEQKKEVISEDFFSSSKWEVNILM